MMMTAEEPLESAYVHDNALAGGGLEFVDADNRLDGGAWSENLSISFDSLMAFLDEDNSGLPPDSEPLQVDLQGLDQRKLSAGETFMDRSIFHPEPESSAALKKPKGELGSFQWDGVNYQDLDASHQRPGVESSLMDSSGHLLNNSIIENLDHHYSWKNLANSNASTIKPEEKKLYTSQDACLNQCFYLDSGKSCDYNKITSESLSKLDVGVLDLNANNHSSIYMAKGGGTDSSCNFMPEGSALTDNVLDDAAEPNTFLQEGNFYPAIARDFFMHPHATFGDSFLSNISVKDATNICNASNNILTSCGQSDSELSRNGFLEFFPLQLPQQSIIRENEVKLQVKDVKDEGAEIVSLSDSSFSSSEVELDTQGYSACTLSPNFPSMEFDEMLIDTPMLNHLQDASFRSESSTDSSPFPSRRNFIAGNLDSLNSEIKVHRAKLPDNGSKDMTITSYGRESAEYDISNTSKVKKIASYIWQYEKYAMSDTSSFQSNLPRSSTSVDDSDLCILDDISVPVNPPNLLARPHPVLERSPFHDNCHFGLSGLRTKANDERLTFHLALQDLSQPKSEANPPEGVLAIPLLRHQRIALSWMVQKETNSLHCSGGILADDQGLGKTISTIALILTERSPPSAPSITNNMQGVEAWNLDDDDSDASALRDMKKPRISEPLVINESEERDNGKVVSSRPAAGTLVVCPTSVLRQWAEELKVKVTEKAKLSFLVYHGSNRTKDPDELAKYDVVLTTYAIVSMEVPKQPLADKDDDEAIKPDIFGCGEDTANKKSTSNRKRSKDQNAAETALQECTARPLARVRWFRVILDEAQSIKNHRTQVARACWGLRAKRRWCLSGTPIQNAIDDLYSYFRFLKFEPYSIYQFFRSTIKVPINRHSVNGYKKLQAVLKTIMLRRTKGTYIDGKPILTLPPKTVTLKRIDFSNDERIFYSSLEAESREQFKVYAALGTVKQNYVNILLMLLRLRQACDHPILVKGSDSNSNWKSSLETTKKLSKEKLKQLMSCLEACSAICIICNDPPEDAVVALCGHVFCNQCICEHLIAEENLCPSVGCKVRLNVASVFSRSTLVSSITEIAVANGCTSCCGSEVADTADVHGTIFSSDSSKIKAAIEILRSLPRIECSPRSSSYQSNNEESVKLDSEANETIQNVSKCSPNLNEERNLVSCKHQRPVTEKAIVFSQWTKMLDLLEIPLKDSCIEYRRLDGTMSVSAREKAVKEFNTCPQVSVMIMSLKAASLGLNMVSACHVILLDLWWNPTTEDQAIDRAHRIGQTRPVTVSRLTVKNTVEDRILGLQQKKREMVANAFGEDETGSRQTRLTVDDLKYLFMVP